MSTRPALHELFEHRRIYPDSDAHDRLARLVGLDDHALRLSKILSVLVNPAGLETWVRKHHRGADQLLSAVLTRPPLVVLAGDVGSGRLSWPKPSGTPSLDKRRSTLPCFRSVSRRAGKGESVK